MRVFIAALIPQEIKVEMKKYLNEVMPHWEGVKWEDHDKFHVTLKFLGEIKESKVEETESALKELVRIYPPFDMEISGFGGFPSLKSPRVLFIGLAENGGLLKLQSDVEAKLEKLGFTKETRPFLPHVTVGRVKGRSRLKGPLPAPRRLSFSISEVAIMKSVLGPGGSKYTPLSVFRLAT